LQIERPFWWDAAACRGRHDLLDLFVPVPIRGRCRPQVPHEVAELCAACPVQGECLAAGHTDGYAIRGGLTAVQRGTTKRRIRKAHNAGRDDRDTTARITATA